MTAAEKYARALAKLDAAIAARVPKSAQHGKHSSLRGILNRIRNFIASAKLR